MGDSDYCSTCNMRLVWIDEIGYVPVSNCHRKNCPFDDWEIDEEINYDPDEEDGEF